MISWTDRVKIDILHKVKKKSNILYKIKRKKANCIVHILSKNWLLTLVIAWRYNEGQK
jgi:hypothetical protein